MKDGIIRKVHAGKKLDGMNFVMSDETIDRMGDVIMADGWILDQFKKNPIALFGHRSDFPLGTWKNVRVERKSLLGELQFAPEGTSDRIDEMRKLTAAGVLNAVSVGFRVLESKPRGEGIRGEIFSKQELFETSLVAIPANPNALSIAKSLDISDEVHHLVFAEHGNKDERKANIVRGADMLELKTLRHWSPNEAKNWKNWAANQAALYPLNPRYRKLYSLMEEIETVRTITLFVH